MLLPEMLQMLTGKGQHLHIRFIDGQINDIGLMLPECLVVLENKLSSNLKYDPRHRVYFQVLYERNQDGKLGDTS